MSWQLFDESSSPFRWSYILYKLIEYYVTDLRNTSTLWDNVGTAVKVFQNAAVLEVTHLMAPVIWITLNHFLFSDRSCGHRRRSQQRCADHITSLVSCYVGLWSSFGNTHRHFLRWPPVGFARLVHHRNHSLCILWIQPAGHRSKGVGAIEVSWIASFLLVKSPHRIPPFQIHHFHRTLSNWRHRRTALLVHRPEIRQHKVNLERWIPEYRQLHLQLLLLPVDRNAVVHSSLPATVLPHVCFAEKSSWRWFKSRFGQSQGQIIFLLFFNEIVIFLARLIDCFSWVVLWTQINL